MLLIALSFLAGILSLMLFPELPGPVLYLALLLAISFCRRQGNARSGQACRAATVFVFGLCWAQLHASYYLDRVLPETLAGKDIKISGRVYDIPVNGETVQRFGLEVDRFTFDGYQGPVPAKIKLSWYYGEQVRAGETWQFLVRLKPPHGFMNPGGFDYEAWLFQNGIHATGYVRTSTFNRMRKPAATLDIAAVRQKISEAIRLDQTDSSFTGFIVALAVGDRSVIDRGQWDVLIKTGTNHLMAISGLHIGLAAAFGYWLCRRLLPAALMLTIPAQHVAMISAIIVALIYAMLAGFAIPTQRALLMLLCVAGGMLTRRVTRPVNVLAFALILVLLRDPASVMSAGFWFSFLAVGVIFFACSGRTAQSRWLKWGWLQLVIALALFPLSLYLFQQASLVSPLANMLMVPYVSLLVVPLVLTGMLISLFSGSVATVLFAGAARLFELIWPVLQWLSVSPYSHWVQPQPGLLLTVLALSGVAIVLAPRLRFWRVAGIVLMLPAAGWQPRPPPDGAFELNVLDVGQGLAIVVRTRSHTLVYDAGARFSDRLDSGEAVIRPFLTYKGVDKLDLLMISHGDGDHIGGAPAILEAYPETPVLGQGIAELGAKSKLQCSTGQEWTWDEVKFTVLHPDGMDYRASNNRSCVLKVESRGGSVLITGDIEKKIENRLLLQHGKMLPSDILIAPHHGSKSSSSARFISAVSPEIVIFAAGYRNRYRFPAEAVVERYATQGTDMYMTGAAGAVTVAVHPRHGIGDVRRYRASHAKYWNHIVPKLRQDG
jgi:competence protein ComEC